MTEKATKVGVPDEDPRTEAEYHESDTNVQSAKDVTLTVGKGDTSVERVIDADITVENNLSWEERRGIGVDQMEYEGSMTFQIEDLGTAFMMGVLFVLADDDVNLGEIGEN